MSSTLGFSEIDSTNLIKQLKPKKENISNQIKDKLKEYNDEEDDNALMSDFTPPPPALSAKQLYKSENPPVQNNFTNKIDNSLNTNKYKSLDTNKWNEDYFKQYIPSYNSISNSDEKNSNNLTKKINYMIHLLEEQQDIKAGSISEEIVLYCFLGVFIIFIVDSFAKVGRYVR